MYCIQTRSAIAVNRCRLIFAGRNNRIVSRNNRIVSRNNRIVSRNNRIVNCNNRIVSRNNRIVNRNNRIVNRCINISIVYEMVVRQRLSILLGLDFKHSQDLRKNC